MELIKSALKNSNGVGTNQQGKGPSTLICFSHLRWDFVYQRPQHLLSRFATMFDVYFIEEPHFDASNEPTLSFKLKADNLWVVTPHLPANTSKENSEKIQKTILDKFVKKRNLQDFIFWYYTPMALPFSRHYTPGLTIYDCMDELSHFKNAPKELIGFEKELFQKADLVFTGGHSLYEYKKDKHKNIHPFPSSIDKKHFEQARTIQEDPADQAPIGKPRLGFYGVIDERFDIDLIAQIAQKRPDWNIVLLGPVVKINPDTLPRHTNIHYLGQKSYNELPSYLSGWNVAMVPFMLNDSTKFISPTKTPEYLAAGIPVVSTPIKDVVSPYGDEGMVSIASNADEFVAAAERYMKLDKKKWLPVIDDFLSSNSWSITFMDMMKNINNTVKKKQALEV
ncbi:MAG: glycosyltransferase family 1 protein [Segetibacter sp.]|nr:glycosyltransferase family 1 protein [Segetibacter sp.]